MLYSVNSFEKEIGGHVDDAELDTILRQMPSSALISGAGRINARDLTQRTQKPFVTDAMRGGRGTSRANIEISRLDSWAKKAMKHLNAELDQFQRNQMNVSKQ